MTQNDLKQWNVILSQFGSPKAQDCYWVKSRCCQALLRPVVEMKCGGKITPCLFSFWFGYQLDYSLGGNHIHDFLVEMSFPCICQIFCLPFDETNDYSRGST